jgi:hypothetical protein
LLAASHVFPGRVATAMLVGLYLAGSTAIFLAKTEIVRAANHLLPGYVDMVANQTEAAGHW